MHCTQHHTGSVGKKVIYGQSIDAFVLLHGLLDINEILKRACVDN